MSDVFISYSRKDKAFVQQLHDELVQMQREIWVDWEDIPPTADWWREICNGIDGANTFVFVISPDSVRSQVCRDEVDYAISNKKRFVPVLYRAIAEDTDRQHMHPAIGTHNWIMFHNADFDAAFKLLVNAIDTDLSHVREHTRLLVRAREWAGANRDPSFLLGGSELHQSEVWLSAGVTKQPQPTELHTEYILTSRHNANRRQRTLFAVGTAALVISLTLAALSFILFQDANTQRGIAEDALGLSEMRGTQVAQQAETAVAAQGTAVFEADRASTQENNALNNAMTAVAAQATAVFQADRASTQEHIALNNAVRATLAQGDALIQAERAQTAAANALNAQATALFEADSRATQQWIAQNNASTAVAAQETAVFEADRASTQQVIALNNAVTATLAQGDALIQAELAQTAAANALNSQATAVFEADSRATQQALAQKSASTAVAAQETAVFEADRASTQQAIAFNNAATATFALGLSELRGTQIAAQVVTVQAAGTAESNALATSVAEGNIRATQQQLAQESEATALAAQGTAVFERDRADDNSGTAVAALDTAERNAAEALSLALSVNAEQALAAFDPDLALLLALKSNEIDPTSVLALKTLFNMAYGPGTRMVFGHGRVRHNGAVTSVAFSPDGRYVASAGGILRPPTYNTIGDAEKAVPGEIFLWDAAAGDLIRKFENGHTDTVTSIAFSPDGQYLLSGGYDKRVILWDVETGALVRTFGGNERAHANRVTHVAFRPNGQTAISSSLDSTYIVWDVATGRQVNRFLDGGGAANVPVYSFDVSPDSSGLYVLGMSQAGPTLWVSARGRKERSFAGIGWQAGAFTPGGQAVVVYTDDGFLTTFNIVSRQEEDFYVLAGSLNEITFAQTVGFAINDIAFSPDGQYIIAAAGGISAEMPDTALKYTNVRDSAGTVYLWAVDVPLLLQRYDGLTGAILSVAFNPEGTAFVSGSSTGDVRLWTFSPEPGLIGNFLSPNLNFARDSIHVVGFSPDGQKVTALLDNDRTPALFDLASGELLRRFTGHVAPVVSIALSPDGQTLLTGDERGSIYLWDVPSGRQIHRLLAHEDAVQVVYGRDGQTALSGSASGNLNLWNLATGRVIHRLNPRAENVTGLAYSLDGQRLLSIHPASKNTDARAGLLILWDAASGQEIKRIEVDDATSAVFSSDSRYLRTGIGREMRLWDARTGEPLTRGERYVGPVDSPYFSPDGQIVLMSDGTLRDVGTGEVLFNYDYLTSDLGIIPNPDWTLLMTNDGTLINIATREKLVEWIYANRYVRDLTCDERELYRLRPLCEVVEIPTPTPVPTATPSRFAIIDADQTVNMRSGAGTSFPVIAKTQTGVNVEILEEVEGWTKIRLPDGTEGWVIAEVVRRP